MTYLFGRAKQYPPPHAPSAHLALPTLHTPRVSPPPAHLAHLAFPASLPPLARPTRQWTALHPTAQRTTTPQRGRYDQSAPTLHGLVIKAQVAISRDATWGRFGHGAVSAQSRRGQPMEKPKSICARNETGSPGAGSVESAKEARESSRRIISRWRSPGSPRWSPG